MTTARTTTPAPVRLTFTQIAERIRRPRTIVALVLDAQAAAEIDMLDALLGRLGQHPDADAERQTVLDRLRDAEAVADDSRAHFTLEAVSHRAYQRLRAEHPASREQIEEAKRLGGSEPPFNADTFAPALVHAQLIEPAADREEFEAFWDELSDGQLSRLWTSALAVQLQINDPRAAAGR